MKPLTDKMIAEALEFKKNKIWETLKPDTLLALTFADGTVGYINVFCPTGQGLPWITGLALFRADELSSYHFMAHSPKGMDEVEARVQSCLMSCIWMDFASKDRVPDEYVDAIRQYRMKKGIRASGKNAFFKIVRYVPQMEPRVLTDRSDRTHIEEALHFLNWLSRHGSGEGLPLSDGKIPCFKASGRTYEMTEIDLPPMKEYDFPKVPFHNEVLAHRLKKAGKRGALDCNLVILPMAVAVEEDERPLFPLGPSGLFGRWRLHRRAHSLQGTGRKNSGIPGGRIHKGGNCAPGNLCHQSSDPKPAGRFLQENGYPSGHGKGQGCD